MKFIVSVTTTRPSSTVSPGGGGGSLILLDPKTGAILSSLRSSADLSGRAGMGISSVSQFPENFTMGNDGGDCGDSTQPVIAYGGNSLKRGDNYGMLISIRSASSPPILHWKCRLPETEMSGGLVISPCGYYIVGGGFSGSCYIWSSMGGELLRSFKAHYRSCTNLTWSDCGRYLVTGGADCMIHCYSFMDLVDFTSISSKNSKQRNVSPMHTFSVHHFPVTSVIRLPAGRIASAAEDGQVLIIELHSKEVLVNIQFPNGVQCLEHHDGRIYAGSTKGTIYSVDLNAYAMHRTEKLGALFAGKRRRQDHLEAGSNKNWTTEEKVFGKNNPENISNGNGDNTSHEKGYQTDWVGHDHPVTSISLLKDDEQQKMISGDTFGQIRIWDKESRTCLNVIQPWSFTNVNSDEKKAVPIHPVTSIQVIPQSDTLTSHGMLKFSSSRGKNFSNFSVLLTPLHKYISDPKEAANNIIPTPSLAGGKIRVPFLNRNRTTKNLEYWEARPKMRKRRWQVSSVEEKVVTKESLKEKEQILLMREEINKLKNELEDRDSEVKRWQKVNNKLMSKLQTKSL